jgi:hypothetical protein
MRLLRNSLLAILSLALGALLSEGFLRLLIPVEAQFETWFTPGIEEWDPEFGAVYRPDWEGTMRHMDGVYRGVPLKLDEHGFRPPAHNDLPGRPKRILLMGGRSAMMSYGLPENETIPARLVAAAGVPMEAQSIAWAGGNLIRSWNLYRRHLADEDWDLVVISHVNPYLPAYKDHSAFDRVPPPAPKEWIFRYMDGILLWRDGLFVKAGRAAFQSYLGYGMVRLAYAGLKELEQWQGAPEKSQQAIIRSQAAPPDPAALADYMAFLKHVEAHFTARGIPVVLHLIARPYAERNHHAPYREPLSREFDVLDLQERLYDNLSPSAFIANGHYDRELADQIGKELAREVSTRLSATDP